jgi:uncharacterized protein YoxC
MGYFCIYRIYYISDKSSRKSWIFLILAPDRIYSLHLYVFTLSNMADFNSLEKMILSLTQSVQGLESNMKGLESKMDDRFDAVDARFDRIEDTIDDLRSEVRSENIVTRSLLNQAFEHISDQMASKDQSIQPSLIFRHSRSRTRATV